MRVLPESRGKRIFLVIFAIAILLPAGYGFIEKLTLFILAVQKDQVAGFVVVPVVNYLIVTAGMVCLLFWAIAHGMFRNIEQPKYDMLQREEDLDHAESAGKDRVR